MLRLAKSIQNKPKNILKDQVVQILCQKTDTGHMGEFREINGEYLVSFFAQSSMVERIKLFGEISVSIVIDEWTSWYGLLSLDSKYPEKDQTVWMRFSLISEEAILEQPLQSSYQT